MTVKRFFIFASIAIITIFAKYLYQQPRYINGEVAPNFNMVMIDGQKLSLSDFKGKFVLLDFWGSWCGPCRVENPKLVDLYQKYKSRDFEIISVGIETKRERWLAAIKKDKLDWPSHFSDFKRFNSEAAKLYGIREIPTKFLIDKDGMIIGVNQSVAEIDAVLTKRLP